MALSDDDLLRLVAEERENSIGFENGAEVKASRAQALEYSRGIMSDVPSLPNRSKAVSSDLADAIETILPDLVEIFTGGDDVAAFAPQGEDDEQPAKLETEYLLHVLFQDNPGFLILYTMFKDALLLKTGLVTWGWKEPEYETETFEGKTEVEVMAARDGGAEIEDIQPSTSQSDVPLYDFTLRRTANNGKVWIEPLPPEDFTIASDAKSIKEATYCATRARPRLQDLIASGVDTEVARKLPSYSIRRDDNVGNARDTAGEGQVQVGENEHDLRAVEVVTHYLRLDVEGDGTPKLWMIRTGDDERLLIDKEEVNEVRIAAITPFIVTHRFYGESVHDKIAEVMRIKTALTRMMLDSGYFAINQRHVVDMSVADAEFTISDLLRNEPNVPVRVRGANAITPLNSAGLSFDAYAALEYYSTVAEQRTGVVRNAQGLNPDTLHDTAKGAQALMTAAQKRIRLIARIFAETGVRDMLLGIHATIRENATGRLKARLNKQWVELDPSSWAARNDMTIEVGLGASGRENDLMVLSKIIEQQAQAVAAQQGMNGPLLTAGNLYASLTKFAAKGGIKAPELFWSDPAKAPPQQPQPDPEMAKVQAQAQADQAKMQMQGQLDAAKLQADSEHKRMQIEADMQLKREQMIAEIQLKREQIQAEAALNMQEAQFRMRQTAMQSNVTVGGDPG